MSLRRTLGGLAVIALLAAIAGCGGSSAKPVTAAELVPQGDAICAANKQRFAQIQAQPISIANVVDQTAKLADSANQELDQLRGLAPPSQLKAPYDAYLAAKQQALDLLKQAKDAADQQDSRRYAELQKKAEASAPERLKLARAVGFKTCSKR